MTPNAAKKRYVLTCIVFICHCTILTAQICSDIEATPMTKALYANLYKLKDKFTILGHQDALAYGVGWKYENGRSDIKSVVNDNAGLYGWDIGHLELDSSKNLDGVPFNKMKNYIKEAHAIGGLVTLSWHASNPFTGKSAWDTTPGTLRSILPGNPSHEKYKAWLDKVALFVNDLKAKNGEHIPILFRPFHELTGNWFWWCKNGSTPEEFIELWRFTVNYLQKQKKMHHLIYVYNTADFKTENDFLAYYPGDDVVDIVSFDKYQYDQKNGREDFISIVERQLKIANTVAVQKNKILAIAETGFEAIPDSIWWTNTLYPLLEKHPISFVLLWRNAGYMRSMQKMHYYAPYENQVSAKNFKQFYLLPKMLFQKKLSSLKIYQ